MNKKENNEKYSHFETDMVRGIFVEGGAFSKIKPGSGIKIKIEDPELKKEGSEMELIGFTTISDKAGDEVLYVKFNHEKKLILYYETPHTESRRVLKLLKEIVHRQESLGLKYQLRDMRDYLKECYRNIKAKEAGKLKTKPGKHPDMKID